jgi:hypothetical protein
MDAKEILGIARPLFETSEAKIVVEWTDFDNTTRLIMCTVNCEATLANISRASLECEPRSNQRFL